MTEMVYGAVPVQRGEPILPKWWRTIDKWAMSCILILFACRHFAGAGVSPPSGRKERVRAVSLRAAPSLFRRAAHCGDDADVDDVPDSGAPSGGLGFLLRLCGLGLAAVFGTDFGKGAVRWYSLGFASCSLPSF